MTKKELNKKLKEGTAFLDIDYGEGNIQIYHDVIEDKYYCVDVETSRLKEVYLAVEKRYIEGNAPDDNDLLNDPNIDYDICGEFDNPIETSGPYVWRYGYFKYVHKDTIIPITKLVGYTDLL